MNAVANHDFPSPALLRLAPNQVPDELLNTDRILLRWAASVGDGSKDPEWERLVRARVTELPHGVAILVDQLIMRSPAGYKALVEKWYRTSLPREVIARELGVRKDEVRELWICSLQHFRRHFEGSPLSDLRELAFLDVPGRTRLVREWMTPDEASSDDGS